MNGGRNSQQVGNYQLSLQTVVNNNPDWEVDSRSRRRDADLTFNYSESTGSYEISASGPVFGNNTLYGTLAKPKTTLIQAIDDCLDVWQKKVVNCEDEVELKPFLGGWDVGGVADAAWLDKVWLEIAKAGKKLATNIFYGGDEGLDLIRTLLFNAIAAPRKRTRPLLITVHSDHLFAPWWMLYTVPDGGPPLDGPNAMSTPEGFWGYKHLVEHQTKNRPGIRNATSVAGPLVRTGLNVDPRIDTDDGPFVTKVTTFLEKKVEPVRRERKEQLDDAFSAGTFADEITYFGCHCDISDKGYSSLRLQDGEPITITDVDGWLPGTAQLATRPIIFINACRGGKLSSLLYESLGKTMMAKGANCVIGPQIDMPVTFGGEYAQRLFKRFLGPNRRLGNVVLALTREFADKHRNPLGLAYSLYYGVDVYLARESDTS